MLDDITQNIQICVYLVYTKARVSLNQNLVSALNCGQLPFLPLQWSLSKLDKLLPSMDFLFHIAFVKTQKKTCESFMA